MRKRILSMVYLSSALALWSSLGCHGEQGPPPPLAVEQIPTEFVKAFQNAKPEVKDLSNKVLQALEAKDFPAAHQAVQNLAMSPGATKAQQLLAARALIAITALLQTAQAQGDEKATAALKAYQSTK